MLTDEVGAGYLFIPWASTMGDISPVPPQCFLQPLNGPLGTKGGFPRANGVGRRLGTFLMHVACAATRPVALMTHVPTAFSSRGIRTPSMCHVALIIKSIIIYHSDITVTEMPF